MGVAPGDHIGRDAGLPVRRSGERDQTPLAGYEVPDLDGIADGEDVRVARAHVLVDADPSELADLDPGHGRKGSIGSHAEREYHEVCWVPVAGLRHHPERVVLGLLESGDAVIEDDVNTVELEVVLDDAPVLPIERGKDLIRHLDYRHIEPAMNQVLCHLEADESGANHHRMPLWPHRLEP